MAPETKKHPADSGYWITRLLLQRTFAFIFLLAFLGTAFQFKALCGENGLMPITLYLRNPSFWNSPSLFWFLPHDLFTGFFAWCGVALAFTALTGWSEKYGSGVSVLVWFLLWAIYLSFVNAGGLFYSFGWETMTLEVGFLAIFLGSKDTRTPKVLIWFLRWVLFRLMFGAGLIKLRGDACWRDLTCMEYYYETQPIPNPLSWFFHHLPPVLHRLETLTTHFIEIVVPWGYFGPRKIRHAAGILTILFQAALIVSGNLSWLNYLTIVIAIACFDDDFLRKIFTFTAPETPPIKKIRKIILAMLSTIILALSIMPAVNLASPRQRMNSSFEPFHLVNTYGAFGSITKKRMEIVLEGTSESEITPQTIWKEYEFKAKPGDTKRLQPVVAPYHLRLDWLMWFAAMGPWRYHPWTLNLADKLLKNDPDTLKLIKHNPFPAKPPVYIRAVLYHYRFTTPEELRRTGQWWVREPASEYFPPLSLDNDGFKNVLEKLGF